MYCNNCNSYVQDGSVCGNCGASLLSDTQQQETGFNQQEQQPLSGFGQQDEQPQPGFEQQDEQIRSEFRHQEQPPYGFEQQEQPLSGFGQQEQQLPPGYPREQQLPPGYQQEPQLPPGYPPPGYPPPGMHSQTYFQQPPPGYPLQGTYQQPFFQPPPPGYPPQGMYAQPYYQQPPPIYPPQAMYPQPPYQQRYQTYAPGYGAPYPMEAVPPDFDPSRFSQLLHKHGSSALFLIGIILYMVGNLFNIFLTFTIYSIIPLLLLALPIIGYWLIYSASKSPRLPERTLTGITLFKTSTIISLVAMCILVFIIFIMAFIMLVAGTITFDYYMDNSPGLMNGIGVAFLITAIIVLLVLIFYYRALFQIFNGIKGGMMGRPVFKLDGVVLFTVFMGISIGLGLLTAIINVFILPPVSNDVYYSLYSALYDMPSDLRNVLEPIFISTLDTALYSTIASTLSNVGTLLCIIVLNRFNGRLKTDRLTHNH